MLTRDHDSKPRIKEINTKQTIQLLFPGVIKRVLSCNPFDAKQEVVTQKIWT
jgi:hypothetical protein